MEAIVHHDEPTSEDRLDRQQYAEALARLAESCDSPLVIGLYGTWGIGKTSLMKLIERKLDPTKSFPIWFDPWQHQFDENPVVALAQTLVNVLNLEKQEGAKKLIRLIASAFASSVLNALTGLKPLDIFKLSQRYDEERFRLRDMRVRLRKHFEELIRIAQERDGVGKRLVFFIDDLDRCMPEEALKLLEALKLYLNLPGCIYFLGVDRKALQQSIKHRYKELDIREVDYLDKIIQLPFHIPPIETQSMEAFVDSLLPKVLHPCKDFLVVGLGHNPRQVKRFVNKLMLNHHLAATMGIEEYQPQILALLLLIQTISPKLHELIIVTPDLLKDLQKGEKSEKVQELYNDLVAMEGHLRKALAMVILPEDIDLKPYIYLSQVAKVVQEPDTKPKYIDLPEILKNHQLWLNSSGISGERAKLDFAYLSHQDLSYVNLHRAFIANANLERANLLRANLSSADLRGANLDRAFLSEANLSQTNLIGTRMFGAHLIGSKLRSSILEGADFRKSELMDADLSGANLREAKLSEANLMGANLLGAKVDIEELGKAITDEDTILPDGSRGPLKKVHKENK